MHILIVDDERKARKYLRALLETMTNQAFTIAEAGSVDGAKNYLNENKPDLVFLDVEMPEKNGFQLLEELQTMEFSLVFTTAHEQYALKAFEVSAQDYLLKPIQEDRLIKAIEKVRQQIDNEPQSLKSVKKLIIPHKNKNLLINTEDIIYFEAQRAYVSLVSTCGVYTLAKSMKYFEDMLAFNQEFMRVHRSFLVNLKHAQTLDFQNNGLILSIGNVLPISKPYRSLLEDRLKTV
ncbi:MAG: LytTR family DNA-binding domain-containing protein [Cyclobacteriaceae bacterium]|nr:response regulator transcription factor [Cyclobacteriaceae bacterium]MCH8517602.1 LytTR family DNA-binding domain-containing protein [Cyclobacteriaceae bacterium]